MDLWRCFKCALDDGVSAPDSRTGGRRNSRKLISMNSWCDDVLYACLVFVAYGEPLLLPCITFDWWCCNPMLCLVLEGKLDISSSMLADTPVDKSMALASLFTPLPLPFDIYLPRLAWSELFSMLPEYEFKLRFGMVALFFCKAALIFPPSYVLLYLSFYSCISLTSKPSANCIYRF